MAKILRCGEPMPGCNTVIEGKDEAEVMQKGAEARQDRARHVGGSARRRPEPVSRRGTGVAPRFVRDRRFEMR